MKITVNGQWVECQRLTVNSSDEQWCTYTLSDGTVLKVKPILTSVVRLEEAYNEGGDPVYQLQTPVMVAVEYVPDHLRKESQVQQSAVKGKPQ